MLAWLAEPVTPVLKTTKSLAQLGAPIGSNEYLAGYIPAPTLAPLPRSMPQRPFRTLFGCPSRGRPHDAIGPLFRLGADASRTARASSARIHASLDPALS